MCYFYGMKRLLLYILVTITFSCSEKVDTASLKHLNGYWQIEKVVTAEGDDKEYKANEDYEYFELKDKKGIHKKVRWQPTGKFLTDDLYENVAVVEKDGGLQLQFISAFGKHTNKVTKITETELVLESENENQFYYQKVDVNTINHYGKATK